MREIKINKALVGWSIYNRRREDDDDDDDRRVNRWILKVGNAVSSTGEI